jgi:hypothetical protein
MTPRKRARIERRAAQIAAETTEERIVTTRRLGTFGRWGNSLFLYAYARKYAEIHKATLQTPEWLAQKVFKNITEPLIDRELPQTECDQVPWGKVNIDILGYFQNAKFLEIMSRKWLKEIFTFQDRWIEAFPKPKPFYIAAHVRRGDYHGLQSIFALIKESSYLNACTQYGYSVSDIIWVHEDKPTSTPETEAEGIGFLKDFMTLYNADIILRGNSTFSWWAATLSNAKIYSPVIGDNRGLCDVNFVPGNWPMIANFKKWQPHCPQDHGDLYLPEI